MWADVGETFGRDERLLWCDFRRYDSGIVDKKLSFCLFIAAVSSRKSGSSISSSGMNSGNCAAATSSGVRSLSGDNSMNPLDRVVAETGALVVAPLSISS